MHAASSLPPPPVEYLDPFLLTPLPRISRKKGDIPTRQCKRWGLLATLTFGISAVQLVNGPGMPFETHCEAALPLAVLSPEARERLGRISTVKPDKARQVENLLLQAV
eukprot:EG_transcript_43545